MVAQVFSLLSKMRHREIPFPRTVSIFGATGSIGKNTLEVIRHHQDKFRLHCLTALTKVEALAEMTKEFSPKYAVIGDLQGLPKLKELLSGTKTILLGGEEGMLEAASQKVDIVISAIVGMAALKPTLAALPHTKLLGIANKECLVAAGPILLEKAAHTRTGVIPIDSEHSGLFQLLEKQTASSPKKVCLTASGGPFRGYSKEALKRVNLEEALRHPTWAMGPKNTIDSATLVNKGLELIEACYLFGLDEKQVDVLIHPSSLVHSFVHYEDGVSLFHLSQPSMCIPISYALGWPQRLSTGRSTVDLAQQSLNFEKVDEEAFPAIRLARYAYQHGLSSTLVFNAANEVAVSAYLERKISFSTVPILIEDMLGWHQPLSDLEVEDVYKLDEEARRKAKELLSRYNH